MQFELCIALGLGRVHLIAQTVLHGASCFRDKEPFALMQLMLMIEQTTARTQFTPKHGRGLEVVSSRDGLRIQITRAVTGVHHGTSSLVALVQETIHGYGT